MPKIIRPLSVSQIESAKPKDKNYKLSDGGGLYLFVNTKGGKLWRMDYTFNKKRKTLSLGKFPKVKLKEARQLRESHKESISNGIDPSSEKKHSNKKIKSFEDIANEYFEHRDELSIKYVTQQKNRLVNHVYPHIQDMHVKDIKPRDFLYIIKMLEHSGKGETAKRVIDLCDRVFKYAVTLEKITYNPASSIDKSIVLKKVILKNYPHITDVKQLGILLQVIDDYIGDVSTSTAIKLLPYVFLRPENIRKAEWAEIDFEKKQWHISAEKMKMSKAHIVPLTDSIIRIFKSIEPYSGSSRYVFPSPVDSKKPLSDNTLNKAFIRMGYKNVMVPHGFRHTASTILHENMHIHKVGSDAIEMQLAHVVSGVKGVYNKALYIESRVKLMQWYSDFLGFGNLPCSIKP